MAPVSRTLVAVCSTVGSSLVAKIEGTEGEIYTGPSSGGELEAATAVGCSDSWAIHVLWAEQREWRWVAINGYLREMKNGNGGERELGEEEGRRWCCMSSI